MGRDAVLLSFRLGGTDGVSIEARKWEWALGELGFDVRRVAGRIDGPTRPTDVVLPGLAIDAGSAPTAGAIAATFDGADLVVVENVCSLPLNEQAACATADACTAHGGRVVFHHHDLPWQRRGLARLESVFPPRTPGALHVTINHRSARELVARRVGTVVTVANHFDLDAPPGERDATRRALAFTEDELVLFQPARAIERKNVPGGLRYAAQLATLVDERTVHYWLTGPAEDGYAPTLERVVARAPVPVTFGRVESIADAYAAADVVMLPSTWEGFGNATIESVWARRPLVAYPYPVLAEIVACGVRFFPLSDPAALASFLAAPDDGFFDVNLRRARLSFSIDALPAAIDAAFTTAGWREW